MSTIHTLSANENSFVIHASLIKQAKAQALQQQRRIIEVLEDLVEADQASFVSALSACFHYSPISMKEMHTLIAGFDAIPFSKAQQKECLAFFDEDERLTLVFADPFNESLQDWATEFIKQPFTWRLAHRSDIAAFLARHEETMRAMDGLPTGEQATLQITMKSPTAHRDG